MGTSSPKPIESDPDHTIYLVQDKLDAVIIDTAGRLQIDDKLMGELAAAKKVAFSHGSFRTRAVPSLVFVFSYRFSCRMMVVTQVHGQPSFWSPKSHRITYVVVHPHVW